MRVDLLRCVVHVRIAAQTHPRFLPPQNNTARLGGVMLCYAVGEVSFVDVFAVQNGGTAVYSLSVEALRLANTTLHVRGSGVAVNAQFCDFVGLQSTSIAVAVTNNGAVGTALSVTGCGTVAVSGTFLGSDSPSTETLQCTGSDVVDVLSSVVCSTAGLPAGCSNCPFSGDVADCGSFPLGKWNAV